MATNKHAATPALVSLKEAGVPHVVHEYHHDPATTTYGMEAAAALGLDPHRVFKTLLADVEGDLVVAVVPVDRQLDLKGLAVAVGAKKAAMADPGRAQSTTGYVVGGISPLGQRKQLPTVVDQSALDHTTIFVSAGRRGMDVELEPGDLIRLTKARAVPIAR